MFQGGEKEGALHEGMTIHFLCLQRARKEHEHYPVSSFLARVVVEFRRQGNETHVRCIFYHRGVS